MPAAAQSGDPAAPGRTHASSYAPVPEGLTVSVRPWDNTADNLRVKAGLADALSKRGLRLAETNTQLILNFETEVESLTPPDYGPTLGQVQGHNWDKRIRMNVWSTTQDSLTTGRRGGDSGPGTVRYILRTTLDDQRTGQRLWQGEASYLSSTLDEVATFVAMTPVVVESLGQSVRPKGFRIE
jgi:hypothetical protein